MHLAYTNEFSGGYETAGWLLENATAHNSKFAMDQKMIDGVKQFTATPPTNSIHELDIMEEKMVAMETHIMQEIGVKMEKSNKEVKHTLNSILGFVWVGLAIIINCLTVSIIVTFFLTSLQASVIIF